MTTDRDSTSTPAADDVALDLSPPAPRPGGARVKVIDRGARGVRYVCIGESPSVRASVVAALAAMVQKPSS